MHDSNLAVSELLADADRELVFGWLRAFNVERNGDFFARRELPGNAPRPLAILARDASGAPVGGLVGSTQLHLLKIDIMAVAPELRGRGIGRRLVASAESEAIARGCRSAFLDTMSYQAPGFYAGLGYEICGRLRDWDGHGHDKLLFMKDLGPRRGGGGLRPEVTES